MSERITEEELDALGVHGPDWRRVACAGCGATLRADRERGPQAAHDCEGKERTVVMTDLGPSRAERLVAEVRRLRGLIVEMDTALAVACTAKPGEKILVISEQAPAFMREAEAIHAEGEVKDEPAYVSLTDVGVCLRTSRPHRWLEVTPLETTVREYRCADCGRERVEPTISTP